MQKAVKVNLYVETKRAFYTISHLLVPLTSLALFTLQIAVYFLLLLILNFVYLLCYYY